MCEEAIAFLWAEGSLAEVPYRMWSSPQCTGLVYPYKNPNETDDSIDSSESLWPETIPSLSGSIQSLYIPPHARLILEDESQGRVLELSGLIRYVDGNPLMRWADRARISGRDLAAVIRKRVVRTQTWTEWVLDQSLRASQTGYSMDGYSYLPLPGINVRMFYDEFYRWYCSSVGGAQDARCACASRTLDQTNVLADLDTLVTCQSDQYMPSYVNRSKLTLESCSQALFNLIAKEPSAAERSWSCGLHSFEQTQLANVSVSVPSSGPSETRIGKEDSEKSGSWWVAILIGSLLLGMFLYFAYRTMRTRVKRSNRLPTSHMIRR